MAYNIKTAKYRKYSGSAINNYFTHNNSNTNISYFSHHSEFGNSNQNINSNVNKIQGYNNQHNNIKNIQNLDNEEFIQEIQNNYLENIKKESKNYLSNNGISPEKYNSEIKVNSTNCRNSNMNQNKIPICTNNIHALSPMIPKPQTEHKNQNLSSTYKKMHNKSSLSVSKPNTEIFRCFNNIQPMTNKESIKKTFDPNPISNINVNNQKENKSKSSLSISQVNPYKSNQKSPIKFNDNNRQNSNEYSSNNNNINNFKYFLATFIDKIGCNNSFLSVILHLLYRMKFIRNYILSYSYTTTESSTDKNNRYENDYDSDNDTTSYDLNDTDNKLKNKLMLELKSIFEKYPENKKIDLTNFRTLLNQNFNKTINKNKFEMDKPNDPAEFYFSFLNIIHCLYNNKPIYNIYFCDKYTNCNCLIHQNLYINAIKYDECECSSVRKTHCGQAYCIIDIPIDRIIKMSKATNEKMYYSKEKLFSLFCELIKNNTNIQCPLNGKNCNYNRTKRTLKLLNKNMPQFLLFNYELENFNKKISNVLHSLILIPDIFEIETLFYIVKKDNDSYSTHSNPSTHSTNNTHNNPSSQNKPSIQYEFIGCIFQKITGIYTCTFKNDIQRNNKNIWTYYDDENLLNFYGWVDVISYCLKNFLIPYLLVYQIKNNNGEYISQGISKQEYKIIDRYIKKYSEFCSNSGNNYKNRCNDKLFFVDNEKDIVNKDNTRTSFGINLINNNTNLKDILLSNTKNPFKRESNKVTNKKTNK